MWVPQVVNVDMINGYELNHPQNMNTTLIWEEMEYYYVQLECCVFACSPSYCVPIATMNHLSLEQRNSCLAAFALIRAALTLCHKTVLGFVQNVTMAF